MISKTIFWATFALAPAVVKSWSLVDTYNGNNWASMFWLESGSFNNEYVSYLTGSTATSAGLVQNLNGKLYLGVDTVNVLNPTGAGRSSVRLHSNKAYNSGSLVIGDFAHIPGNICGVWPSFWMFGPSWPLNGEVDIIEGVNQQAGNDMTIHTRPGCVPHVGPTGQTGTSIGYADCGTGGGGTGCGVADPNPTSYGAAANSAGGGTYAMLWVGTGIQVWHWQAGKVPADITAGAPYPESWGTPAANWAGCDFGTIMNNMNIIVDTTFCGSWAGTVWSTGSCKSLAPTCQAYVAANPTAFKEAYWLINSIKVYQ